MSAWLLPESIADILPSEARRIEELRRKLLDLFRTYGYELVMPPMLEYVESLLTGTGHALDLKTFKLVDQVSGRTLGLRADMTPQVARIDAHLLNRAGVTRLCYAGHVLHTRAAGLYASREPIQCGAELYGHGGVEADMEVLRLAVDSLHGAGLHSLRVDLCHADIVIALIEPYKLDLATQAVLYDCLQAKDVSALVSMESVLPDVLLTDLCGLMGLYGPALGADGMLNKAKNRFSRQPRILAALDTLERLSQALASDGVTADLTVTVMLDLADLQGYAYHSGVMFSLYAPGCPNALARGGRYDNVGQVFGRARAATGFSTDLRELVRLTIPRDAGAVFKASAIRAPWNDERQLEEAIRSLRNTGNIVVRILPGSNHEEQEFVCDRELVPSGSAWVVQPFTPDTVLDQEK